MAPNLDITPLPNVHGWDDEPQTKAFGCCDTPSCTNHVIHGAYDRDGLVFCDDCQSEQPAPLQLREGAWYRRRDGKVVGPLESFSPSDERHYKQPWRVWNGEYYDTYYDDGYWNVQREEQSLDLIAEVLPPVEPPIGSCVGHSMGPAMVEKPDADGWIEHDGKGCPVDDMQIVDIRYRDGSEGRLRAGMHLGCWKLMPRPYDSDIVAYRLVQPAPITHWVEVVGL